MSRPLLLVMVITTLGTTPVDARTDYRCVREGTVSRATAPEPGLHRFAKQLDDGAATLPNLWGAMGVFHGTRNEREQDGKTVCSTRNLPGLTPLLAFTVATPAGPPAHVGLGKVGAPQPGEFSKEFKAAARRPTWKRRGCTRSHTPKAPTTLTPYRTRVLRA